MRSHRVRTPVGLSGSNRVTRCANSYEERGGISAATVFMAMENVREEWEPRMEEETRSGSSPSPASDEKDGLGCGELLGYSH